MPENVTLNVNVDVRPFGTVQVTERVYFEVAPQEGETITAPATTEACESLPASLPHIVR